MSIIVENVLSKGLDSTINFLIKLLELDLEENLIKEVLEDEIECKRFKAFIEALSPGDEP